MKNIDCQTIVSTNFHQMVGCNVRAIVDPYVKCNFNEVSWNGLFNENCGNRWCCSWIYYCLMKASHSLPGHKGNFKGHFANVFFTADTFFHYWKKIVLDIVECRRTGCSRSLHSINNMVCIDGQAIFWWEGSKNFPDGCGNVPWASTTK